MIAGNAGGSAVGENSCSFLNFIALYINNWLSEPILILQLSYNACRIQKNQVYSKTGKR